MSRAGAFIRRPFAKRPWTFEVALFALALVVYQASRALVIGEPSTAFENAAGIIDWEKSSGLFVESSIQEWVLNHLQLAEVLNYFPMYAHWTVTPLFFIWLYRRRRRCTLRPQRVPGGERHRPGDLHALPGGPSAPGRPGLRGHPEQGQ